ncbi:MAG: ATP-binding cassette domain-containing protein [Actinomycetota bacterium]
MSHHPTTPLPDHVSPIVASETTPGSTESTTESTSSTVESPAATTAESSIGRGSVIEAQRISVAGDDGNLLLDGVTLTLRPGELTAIVGASGAGKSTLLRAVCADRELTDGRLLVDGDDVTADPAAARRIGFVPQTDPLPNDLPLGRMMRYAARLRLPRHSSRAEVQSAVVRALEMLDLQTSIDTTVGQLSGGQQRRASIAVELLDQNHTVLLDEPTSGLDPTTASVVVDELRALAVRQATVVFSTHRATDLARCDRIIAVGSGAIVFDGSLAELHAATGVDDYDQAHRALIAGRFDHEWRPNTSPDGASSTSTAATTIATATAPTTDATTAATATTARPATAPTATGGSSSAPSRWTARPTRRRQWSTLTVRTLDGIVHNRLTLGVMIGAPAMVIAMFAVLFRRGAFDAVAPSPTAVIMITFWIAFGSFFFGLTYGLLQICTELASMRRERRIGVGAFVQVAAKFAALAPVLIGINVAMLAVLRWLDRLPAISAHTAATLTVTLGLGGCAALALGLAASALVASPAQASLALPMLCFPAVLFSGAILPVPQMAPAGQAISAAMSDRWAFAAVGRDLGVVDVLTLTSAGSALRAEFGSTWSIGNTTAWMLMAGFTLVFTAIAVVAVDRRCRQ